MSADGSDWWPPIREELDEWVSAKRRVRMWWRDDDATVRSEALSVLAGLAAEFDIQVALAVIPAQFQQSLVDALMKIECFAVLPHGFAHVNHAPKGEKKVELGWRPVASVLADLELGLQRFDRFDVSWLPILVPPWNRIDVEVVPRLESIGFRALSTFGPTKPTRSMREGPSIRRVNCHINPVDWRGTRGFVGARVTSQRLLAQLRAQREQSDQPQEPIGLMTHHAVHDLATWGYLRSLMQRLRTHRGVQWLAPAQLLAPA